MRTHSPRFASILSTAAIAFALTGAASPADLHLKLEKAEPAIDGTVATAPTEIRLFFSEKPNPKLTAIKLLNASKAEIPLGDVTPESGDEKIVAAALEKTIAAGTYTVTWRTMSADSHVVSGEFEFTVQPGH
jgi:methionine-rich copper-binding protein CopC